MLCHIVSLLKKISSNPIYLFTSYVVSLFISTVVFSVLENQTVLNSLYWSVITSLTIGYGDFSPSTPIGKLFTIFMAHFWIFFIIPSVISHILANLIEDRNAFTHEEQEEIKQTLKHLKEKNL